MHEYICYFIEQSLSIETRRVHLSFGQYSLVCFSPHRRFSFKQQSHGLLVWNLAVSLYCWQNSSLLSYEGRLVISHMMCQARTREFSEEGAYDGEKKFFATQKLFFLYPLQTFVRLRRGPGPGGPPPSVRA